MSHLPDPTQNLNETAQHIYDNIIVKRDGKHYPGLFPALMNYPELAEKFAEFSSFLRFSGVLPAQYREFAILALAAKLRIPYIFTTHEESALAAGLSPSIIQQIAIGQIHFTDFLYDDIHECVLIFLRMEVMPQFLQDRVVAKLGYPAFMQLVTVIGMYRMIADFVVAFEFPLPEGMKSPW